MRLLFNIILLCLFTSMVHSSTNYGPRGTCNCPFFKTEFNSIVCVETTEDDCSSLSNTTTVKMNPQIIWVWAINETCPARGSCCDGISVCQDTSKDGCKLYQQVVQNNLTFTEGSDCVNCTGATSKMGLVYRCNATTFVSFSDTCDNTSITINNETKTLKDWLVIATNETVMLSMAAKYSYVLVYGNLETATDGSVTANNVSIQGGNLNMNGGSMTSSLVQSDKGTIALKNGAGLSTDQITLSFSSMTSDNASVSSHSMQVDQSTLSVTQGNVVISEDLMISSSRLVLSSGSSISSSSLTINPGSDLIITPPEGLTVGNSQTITVANYSVHSGFFQTVSTPPADDPCMTQTATPTYKESALLVTFSMNSICDANGNLIDNGVQWRTPAAIAGGVILVIICIVAAVGSYFWKKRKDEKMTASFSNMRGSVAY